MYEKRSVAVVCYFSYDFPSAKNKLMVRWEMSIITPCANFTSLLVIMLLPLSRMFMLVSPRINRSFSIKLKALSPSNKSPRKKIISLRSLYNGNSNRFFFLRVTGQNKYFQFRLIRSFG